MSDKKPGAKGAGGGEGQGEFEGFVPAEVREIRDAAAKLWRVREDAKEVRKTLKSAEDKAAADLFLAMEKHGKEACKAGAFLIVAEAKTRMRVVKKLERKMAPPRLPSSN